MATRSERQMPDEPGRRGSSDERMLDETESMAGAEDTEFEDTEDDLEDEEDDGTV